MYKYYEVPLALNKLTEYRAWNNGNVYIHDKYDTSIFFANSKQLLENVRIYSFYDLIHESCEKVYRYFESYRVQ